MRIDTASLQDLCRAPSPPQGLTACLLHCATLWLAVVLHDPVGSISSPLLCFVSQSELSLAFASFPSGYVQRLSLSVLMQNE